MLRRTYDWLLAHARAPYALWLLASVSFIESSVFPIPPDVLLIPMVIAAPHRAWLIAGVCTIASVAGGLAGYALGFWFFETIGEPVLTLYGYAEKFETFQTTYNDWGAWAVLIAGITPFPYKVITILSGVTQLDIVVFTVASLVARAARFFLVAALLWKFGPPVKTFIEERLGLVFTVSLALLFGGFIVARYAL
jgi:membrane protein YqaA with SNARE-associated domain